MGNQQHLNGMLITHTQNTWKIIIHPANEVCWGGYIGFISLHPLHMLFGDFLVAVHLLFTKFCRNVTMLTKCPWYFHVDSLNCENVMAICNYFSLYSCTFSQYPPTQISFGGILVLLCVSVFSSIHLLLGTTDWFHLV